MPLKHKLRTSCATAQSTSAPQMRSIWCVVFWGLIWSQLYTSCLTKPPATKFNITHQETLQPKKAHLTLYPGNVYPVHEHDKQRRKPTRTPTPTPTLTPKLKTFNICKRIHAILNISFIFAMLQDGFDQWQRGDALRKDFHRGQLRGPRPLPTSVQWDQRGGGPTRERKTYSGSNFVLGERPIRPRKED